jgi:hypothetical protein
MREKNKESKEKMVMTGFKDGEEIKIEDKRKGRGEQKT